MAKNENEYKRKTQPGKETLNHKRKVKLKKWQNS